MSLPIEVSCAELQQLKGIQLLDVRRADEREICVLPGLWIPLSELQARFGELPKEPLVVYCHHGVRSLSAAHFLKSQGFDAASLQGGIDAWSRDVDPDLPRY